MNKFLCVFCFTFLFFTARTTFCQTKIDSAEISSDVPELYDFHDIIYPMWHNAYPAKDIKALKDFVPEIKSSMTKINNAKLPGILREREDKWKNQLKEFNNAAENYYKASSENNDKALLDAAEKLHYNFEMMVRVLRPVFKEIDDYHVTLYIIYHKLYPEKKYDEIGKQMDNLINKAVAITKIPNDKLKKRLGGKTTDFDAVSKELYDATVALKEELKSKNEKKIDGAIQKMHSIYQKLDKLFN
jgi:hypothetical protein